MAPSHVFSRQLSTAPEPAGSTDLGDLPVWNLSDLYKSIGDPQLKADMARMASEARAFEDAWKGKLAEAAGQTGKAGLGAAIERYEAIEEVMGRIMSFAGLNYFSDTTDTAAAKFYGDAQSTITDISTHLLFFGLELNRLDDAVIAGAVDNDPRAARYKPWLDDLRLARPHQLEDRIEQLFHEKSITGHSAWNRLFDETMSALRFSIDGEELAIEPALSLLQDPDREARRKAAEALASTFSDNIRTFTLITNTLAKDKEISDRWHGFADIADSRHLANRVERPVVEALVQAVTEAAPRLSHRYYAIKAKWLGLEKLEFWDRNAPLPETPTRTILWDEARETVLSAYHGFAPEMADIAGRFFDRRWIDAPVRPGKASGAFAHPTVPSVHPYVLVNYMGKPRDVMTLAHELGHGVHQVLAGGQGPLMAATPLTLAETASVFGEMLTFRRLLSETTDPGQRKAMLAQKVEDMINTVVRQIAFYKFEREVHTARREGELTAEQLGRLWVDVQAESLGPAVRLSEAYETFWAYIPHFVHSPFYVYAYAFGDCLVNSLYAVYERSPDGFQQRYFDMLRAGGTKHHSELLAPFGLDAGDPEFWGRGLQMLEGFIDEIEALDR
ncbi:M3 family oligoendopeptidase [Pseudohoeflea coraliihabitans]|uniref:M3 family oligoendopeptidase n=1 Tax=Pseudohoeflea coraliihabitans TaxID=2860393 RepID=A0ABS6WPF3_9HYPH|nr:M3 family oligoendopeptidase [Pseudohoeflea sp. DP4N28-3]MBW3097851.1 M3 family oligoendopeptidase [Pseudohoeflea sp. DP4N28-3]